MKTGDQHNLEIGQNLEHWRRKPLLQAIYQGFYERIAGELRRDLPGRVVELGSGIGNLRLVVPDCLCTDLFANPGIDQVEDAYALSFGAGSVSNLVLVDVFHHLEYPGTALEEFHRVLVPGGRVVLFEPCLSVLGWLVYGACHHEPIGWRRPITWERPAAPRPGAGQARYYSAQGNASRIFLGHNYRDRLKEWKRVRAERLAAISYVGSGGYRGPQLYPGWLLPLMQRVDRLGDRLPWLCATRLLVVLEKAGNP